MYMNKMITTIYKNTSRNFNVGVNVECLIGLKKALDGKFAYNGYIFTKSSV
jgi:hypothetical protein